MIYNNYVLKLRLFRGCPYRVRGSGSEHELTVARKNYRKLDIFYQFCPEMSGRNFAIRLKLLTRLYSGDGQKPDILSHFSQFFDVGTAVGTSLKFKTQAGLADLAVFPTPETCNKKYENSQFFCFNNDLLFLNASKQQISVRMVYF